MRTSLAKLALTHALANALLLWLGYYWLGLGEGRAAALSWSALVALALVSVTFVAALIPGRRAMRVDPAIALRAD